MLWWRAAEKPASAAMALWIPELGGYKKVVSGVESFQGIILVKHMYI